MQQKTIVVVGLGPVAHRFLEASVARGVSGTHRIVVFGDEPLATGSYPFVPPVAGADAATLRGTGLVVGGGLVLVALADPPDAAPVG